MNLSEKRVMRLRGITIFALFSLICLGGEGMAQANSASSVEEVFEKAFLVMLDRIQARRPSVFAHSKYLRLQIGRKHVVWGAAQHGSPFQLHVSDRDSFKAANGGELPALMNRFLKQKGFGIEALGKDSTWPVKYRTAYLLTSGRLHYHYIYEVCRKTGGGWCGCLYMLYRDEAVKISNERPEDVFHAVLQWVEKREPPSSEFSLFNLQFKAHKYKLEFGGRKYKYRLNLSFSYHIYNRYALSTPNGFLYYMVMPQIFIQFLEDRGYEVEVIQDMSQPSWSRTLYAATKKRHKPIRFYYEAENSLSAGVGRLLFID